MVSLGHTLHPRYRSEEAKTIHESGRCCEKKARRTVLEVSPAETACLRPMEGDWLGKGQEKLFGKEESERVRDGG